jgi:hypothetical protein
VTKPPDFRALCADLLRESEKWKPILGDYGQFGICAEDVAPYEAAAERVRAALEAAQLPPGYIDPGHNDDDRKLLEVFYTATRSEGGTADEIYLRGLRAVLARCSTAAPVLVAYQNSPPENPDNSPNSLTPRPGGGSGRAESCRLPAIRD